MHSAKPDTRGRRGENPPKNPTRHPAHVWPRLIATPAVRGAGPRTAPPAGRPHPAQRPRSAARAPCAAAERRQRAGPGGCGGTAAPVPPQDAACCAGRPLRPLRPRAKAAQPRRSPSRLGRGGTKFGSRRQRVRGGCGEAAGRSPPRSLPLSISPSLTHLSVASPAVAEGKAGGRRARPRAPLPSFGPAGRPEPAPPRRPSRWKRSGATRLGSELRGSGHNTNKHAAERGPLPAEPSLLGSRCLSYWCGAYLFI